MNIAKCILILLISTSVLADSASLDKVGAHLSEHLDGVDTSSLYFDDGSLKYRKNGVAKRDDLFDSRKRKKKNKKLKKPIPIHDILDGMGFKNVFLLPSEGKGLDNLGRNITRDVVEEFLSKPLSDQKGVDFYDPNYHDRDDTPALLMLNYLSESQNKKEGFKFTDKGFRKFILFTREQMFGKAFAKDLSDDEFKKIVANFNKLREVVRVFTTDDKNKKISLNGKYRKHTENILKSVLIGKSSDYKISKLEKAIPPLTKDILTDTIYKLIPIYAKKYFGEDTTISDRKVIEEKINNLIVNHEFSYFKDSTYFNNDLKGNLESCLKKALVADALISCTKEFTKSTHGKVLEIALESIQLGKKKDLDQISLSIENNVKKSFLKNFKKFPTIELSENDRELAKFYLNKQRDILNKRREATLQFDFSNPVVKNASFNLVDDVETSDPQYLKLRMTYAIEKSANEWFDDFLKRLGVGIGLSKKSKKLNDLKKKFKGENGLIRKIVNDFINKTDLGTDRNIFSTYLDVASKGLPIVLKNIKDTLNDSENEKVIREIARVAVDKKLEQAIGSKIINTKRYPYRAHLVKKIKGITDTAIKASFLKFRGIDDEKFVETILNKSERDSFAKDVIIKAITTNEKNLVDIVKLIVDQSVERYKIKPYAVIDKNGEFKEFNPSYLEQRNKLVKLIIKEANKQVESSINKHDLEDLMKNYESIAITALRGSLLDDLSNGKNFRKGLESSIKESTDWAIDFYTDQLNSLLDHHMISRDPLYKDSFISVFGLQSDCRKYFRYYKSDSRHFGSSFLLTRENLKKTADEVVKNLLSEIQSNKSLKSTEDIKKAINDRLKVEVKKFLKRNSSRLNKMSENFANRAVCDLLPISDLEPGSKTEKTFVAFKDHLTSNLGPKVFNNLSKLDKNFDFFNKEIVLDKLKDSTLRVAFSKNGTLDKFEDFIQALTNEKIDKFLGRYASDPKLSPLIKRLKSVMKNKVSEALLVFKNEMKNQSLTMEGINKFIENFDKKTLDLFQQSFLTRVDPRDKNSKILSEAIGIEIINYEIDNVAKLLRVEKGTDSWKKIEKIKQELADKSVPQLISKIKDINLGMEVGYKSSDDSKTKIGAINDRYRKYFIDLRQTVVDAFNKNENKDLVRDAVDTFVDEKITSLKSSLIPKPEGTYSDNSELISSFNKLQSSLKVETDKAIESILTYDKPLNVNEAPIDRIRKHVDESVFQMIDSAFSLEPKTKNEPLQKVVSNLTSELLDTHLKAFLQKVGIKEPSKTEAFHRLKQRFILKFEKEMLPMFKEHIKSSMGASLFHKLSKGEGAKIGDDILDKSFQSFNKIFLNDPEMKEYIFQISDLMVDEMFKEDNLILFKKYKSENNSPASKYKPILKAEIKSFINALFEESNGELKSLDDFFKKVQNKISDFVYTPQRASFLAEVSARNLYSEEGYKLIKKNNGLIKKVHEIVTSNSDLKERQLLLSSLSKDEVINVKYPIDGITQDFSVKVPFQEWEFLSIAQLLTSPSLRMKNNEGLDPFLSRLKEKDIGNAIEPFAGRLIDFLKYQTFCEISEMQANGFPCHTTKRPILSEEMTFLVEYLRNTAMAPYSENGGQCFKATWNLLSKKRFSKHIENEEIDIIKNPLKSIAIFIEKEGIAYQKNPPSFMDCSVLAYGVGFGQRIPKFGLDLLAKKRPEVADNVERMKSVLDVYASPESFRAYLESPRTQETKKRMQENLVSALKNYSTDSKSNFKDPHEALMGQFVLTLTHDYLPSISKSDQYRKNSLNSLILIKKDDPGELIKATAKLIIEGKTDQLLDSKTDEDSWLAGVTGTDVSNWINEKLKQGSDEFGSIVTESVDYFYEVKDVFDKFGHNSKATSKDINKFANQFPKCFASFNNDFNAPIILSIQFMAAAKLEENERYVNRKEVKIDPKKTFDDMQKYLKTKGCVDYTQGLETEIVKTASAISEIVATAVALKNKNEPESYSDFWESAAKEFAQAGKHIQDHKQKLDLMLLIFNPEIKKENMCHKEKGTSTRLMSSYKKGPLEKLKEKRKVLDGYNSMNFIKRWYYSDEIDEATEEFNKTKQEASHIKKQIEYMSQCLEKDCEP